jgi:hypothetical protein
MHVPCWEGINIKFSRQLEAQEALEWYAEVKISVATTSEGYEHKIASPCLHC